MFKIVAKTNKKVTLTYYRQINDGEGRAFDQFFSEFDGKYEVIDILLHCYGGVVFEGNLIYNILQSAKSVVNIDVVGVAASYGAILLKSIKSKIRPVKGKVRIARNGFIMIHRVHGGTVGNADDMEQSAKLMKDMEKTFIEDLSDSSGISEDEIKKMWFDGSDHWLNATEALKYKIVDEIIDPLVKNIQNINTDMAAQLGEKAMFSKFAALLTNEPNLNDNTNMKKEEIIARYRLEGVTAESSDSAIYAAVDAQIKAEKDRADKAQNELKTLKEKEITDVIEAAVKDGRILASEGKTIEDVKATFVSIGKSAGIEALKAALSIARPHQTIVSKLQTGAFGATGTGDNAPKDSWDWDKWQKEDVKGLEKMRKDDPTKFNALYNAYIEKYKS